MAHCSDWPKRFTVLAALTAFLVPAAAAQPDAKKPVDELQGKWRIVLMHDRGRKIEVKRDGPSIVIKGNKWLREGGEEIGVFQIDASTNPITIDLKITGEGDEKGRTLEGIVEVRENALRWCFYEKIGEKRRPVTFPSEPDPDIVLYGCERVRDK